MAVFFLPTPRMWLATHRLEPLREYNQILHLVHTLPTIFRCCLTSQERIVLVLRSDYMYSGLWTAVDLCCGPLALSPSLMMTCKKHSETATLMIKAIKKEPQQWEFMLWERRHFAEAKEGL